MKSWIGIDPGKSGGLVCLYDKKMPKSILDQKFPMIVSMPKTEKDIWSWFNIVSSLHSVWGLLEPGPFVDSDEEWEYVAVIEKVHAMPGQGVTSMFTFGMGYGGLRMALIAAGIPFEEVTPRTWQKAFGITTRKKTESKSQFKNRLKAKAQQLFPKEDITLATADALLLAEFCRRKSEGLL